MPCNTDTADTLPRWTSAAHLYSWLFVHCFFTRLVTDGHMGSSWLPCVWQACTATHHPLDCWSLLATCTVSDVTRRHIHTVPWPYAQEPGALNGKQDQHMYYSLTDNSVCTTD